MKLFTTIFLLLLLNYCNAQLTVIDSLKTLLANTKSDTDKAVALYNLSYYYQMYRPDSALMFAETAYDLSIKNKFLKGESWSLDRIAGAFHRLDNYPKALEYYLQQLKIEEKRGYMDNIASVYLNIALVYSSEQDLQKALYYNYKADSIIKKYNYNNLAAYSKLNIGDNYEKLNQLDSALLYTQQCFALAQVQQDDLMKGTSLNNMGNIYFKQQQFLNALQSYKASVPYLQKMQDDNTLAECELGMAKVFSAMNNKDSAYYYANESFNLASKNYFLNDALNASAFLTQFYKQQHNIDSAFAYQQIMLGIKDSVESAEKIKQLQSLTIQEQLRQNEIAAAKLKEAENRHEKMQLLMIGVAIPICFFISIFISRKKVHKKIIESSGIISLLLLFEYVTLLIHPLIAKTTSNSPVFEIIILVIIAALMTPFHHRIQAWLTNRLGKIHHTHAQARMQAVNKKTNK